MNSGERDLEIHEDVSLRNRGEIEEVNEKKEVEESIEQLKNEDDFLKLFFCVFRNFQLIGRQPKKFSVFLYFFMFLVAFVSVSLLF